MARMARRVTLHDRFLAKIKLDQSTGCWLWTGFVDKAGYARLRKGGRDEPVLYAHVYAWEWKNGPVPAGLELDHVRERGCIHRHCVNPAHLEAVTHAANLHRGLSPMMLAHAAGTCTRGHPADEYAYRRKSTGNIVYCRACRREDRAAAKRQ